jgi:hypothetical protein
LFCRFYGTKIPIETLIQSGALNKKLTYQRGHPIFNEYLAYKAAGVRAGKDSVAYKTKFRELKATNPPDKHEQLAPLAARASESAKRYVSLPSRRL